MFAESAHGQQLTASQAYLLFLVADSNTVISSSNFKYEAERCEARDRPILRSATVRRRVIDVPIAWESSEAIRRRLSRRRRA